MLTELRPVAYPVTMSHVIDYIEFAVDDLEQAKAFYAKALGWSFNDYGPDYAGVKDPRTGGEFAGLNPQPVASRGEGVLALIRTDDADAALASVLEAGRPGPDGDARLSRRPALHVRGPVRERPRRLRALRVAVVVPPTARLMARRPSGVTSEGRPASQSRQPRRPSRDRFASTSEDVAAAGDEARRRPTRA